MYRVTNTGRGPLVVHDLSLKPIKAGETVEVEALTAGLRKAVLLELVRVEMVADAAPAAAPTLEPADEATVEYAPAEESDSGAPEAPQEEAVPAPEAGVPEHAEPEVDTSTLPVAEATDWIAEQTDADLLTRATARDRRYTVKRAVQRRLQALNEQPH